MVQEILKATRAQLEDYTNLHRTHLIYTNSKNPNVSIPWHTRGAEGSFNDYVAVLHNKFTGKVIADLSDTDLSNLDLRQTDLSSVFLTNANVQGAFFTEASLSGASVSGVDFTQAGSVKRTDFSDCIGLSKEMQQFIAPSVIKSALSQPSVGKHTEALQKQSASHVNRECGCIIL